MNNNRFSILLSTALLAGMPALAQDGPQRDEFFWLGQMNKATLVINSEEGLLEPALAPDMAAAIAEVVAEALDRGLRRARDRDAPRDRYADRSRRITSGHR